MWSYLINSSQRVTYSAVAHAQGESVYNFWIWVACRRKKMTVWYKSWRLPRKEEKIELSDPHRRTKRLRNKIFTTSCPIVEKAEEILQRHQDRLTIVLCEKVRGQSRKKFREFRFLGTCCWVFGGIVKRKSSSWAAQIWPKHWFDSSFNNVRYYWSNVCHPSCRNKFIFSISAEIEKIWLEVLMCPL